MRVTDNRTNEFTPSYSPDGKKILFSAEERQVLRNDAVEIYTIGIHGKNRVQLTENATNDYFPDYSPDGRRIAYWAPAKRARTSTRSAPAEEIRSNSRRATILTTRPTVRRSSTTQAMAQMGGSIRSTWAVGVSLESRRAPTLPGGSARSGFSSGQSQRPRGLGEGLGA